MTDEQLRKDFKVELVFSLGELFDNAKELPANSLAQWVDGPKKGQFLSPSVEMTYRGYKIGMKAKNDQLQRFAVDRHLGDGTLRQVLIDTGLNAFTVTPKQMEAVIRIILARIKDTPC